MRIISKYEDSQNTKRKLISGDIVFMRTTGRTQNFYGIYCRGYGVIELECGSDAYAKTNRDLFVGDTINSWIVEKVFNNCELIIKE